MKNCQLPGTGITRAQDIPLPLPRFLWPLPVLLRNGAPAVGLETASVHASAWKKLFDNLLKQRAAQSREPFVPFDIDTDYPRTFDGKSRYDGVASFLESRRIELPAEEIPVHRLRNYESHNLFGFRSGIMPQVAGHPLNADLSGTAGLGPF
jgi:hypothetical protein